MPKRILRRVVALALLTAGCVKAHVLRLDSTPRPRTDPGAVQVFAVEPDRPFAVVALVSVSTAERSVEALRARLVQEAAKVGGHAVVFDGQSLATTDQHTRLSAKVIVFRDGPSGPPR